MLSCCWGIRIGLVVVLLSVIFTTAAAQQPTQPIDLSTALAQARALYPNAQLVEAELTRWDNGALAWDIKLNNGLAVYVDARSGQVLEIEPWGRQARPARQERRGPPPWAGFPGGRRAWEAQQGAPAFRPVGPPAVVPPVQPQAQTRPRASTSLSFQQAVAIAQAQFPGAQLVEAELTRWDNGAPAWDVKLNNGFAVYVHAQTGQILEIEPWR